MSLVSKPTIQSYWITNKSIETPYFKYIMSRNRFISIAKMLHFSSNNNSNDALIKIREVSEIVKKIFIRMYIPHKNISIDESLMQDVEAVYITYSLFEQNERDLALSFTNCVIRTRDIYTILIYI